MTSIDNLTIEDFDNEGHNYFGGGNGLEVYDIEKNFMSGGGTNSESSSVDPEANANANANAIVNDNANANANANPNIDSEESLLNLNNMDLNTMIQNNELKGQEKKTSSNIDQEGESSSVESVDPEANISNAESVDPEANISNAESVDPEANISNAESVKLEEKLANNDNIENPDPYGDLPENEFIIDDEDFIIQEVKSKIKIFEEEIIPEHKVIANENDQAEDLINEILRIMPEKLRNNKRELKRISTLLKNLQELKDKFSIKDKKDIFKLTPKLKGKYFVNHVDNILNGNISTNYLVPIVDVKNNLYSGLDPRDTNNKEILQSVVNSEDLDILPDFNFNKKDNSEEIKKSLELRETFRKGKNRINYSFKNELNILNNNITQYKAKKNDLNLKPNKNTFVFRDCFTQECYYYSKEKLDTKEFDKFLVHSDYNNLSDREGPLLQGDYLDINGFIRLPRNNIKLKRLNIDNLYDVCKNSYSYNDLYSNLSNHSIEHVNFKLEVGKKVKLCFSIDNDKTNIDGIIQEIDDNTIFVKPLDLGEDLPNETLEIQKNDKNVNILNVENGERNCLIQDENEFKIFLFDDEEIVNKKILTRYLKNIIPNTNDVIYSLKEQFKKDSHKSLDSLLEYLSFYNLTLDDFNFENFKELIDILYNYNQELSLKADEDEKKYLKFLKSIPQQIRKNVLFINNKSLNDLKKYYGEYPYFGKSIDSSMTRLSWITSQEDNGMLYFKTIIKNITEKMKFDPAKMIISSQKKLDKLKGLLLNIESEIQVEKNKLVIEKNPCLEFRIVKKYTSKQQLESDNEIPIEIDKEFLIYGEGTNFVQEGQYCLLEENGENKLYKRVKLANEKDIWTIETDVNVSQIMKSNKDFCEQQLKNLEEIESSMFNSKSCKFSLQENNCITAELDKKIQKKEALKEKILTIESSIIDIQKTNDFTSNIDKNIETLRNYLLLVNDLSYRKFKNFEQDLEDEEEDEIDPKYEELYKKIDLYLEKISKFSDHKKYLLLDNLIEKYGREYNPANIVKEYEHKIYCKHGNKILCCKHDLEIIKMFKSPDNFENIMENLIETYGIEDNGSHWCKHCGKEIYIADYETIEGFKKSGARDVTHEIVEDESYESKYENVELFESLKKYLDEDSQTSEESLSIFNILNAFLNITGIKLNDNDEVRIMTETTNLCKTNIKTKTQWLQTYKGKPKKADKYYQNYKEVNTIFLTASLLFITLQISVPEYIIKKPHAKCVVSLDGFPLNNLNKKGIQYFSCILETLRNSSSNFECLKKINIEETLEKTIIKLVNDDYYETKLKEKNEYLLKSKKNKLLKKRKNVWNEFKPALEPFEIENNSFDKLLLQDLSEKKNKDNLNLYYSLKVISKVDSIINESNVENYRFNPTPLGNSCCIQAIDNNFNYYNYFNDDATIENLVKQSQNLDNDYFKNTKTQISTNNYVYDRLPTFKNNIYPNEEDITQEEISKLYETYITREYGTNAGKKHAYDNNICLITGQKKEDITQKIYTNEDYFEILDTINQKNSINVEQSDTIIDNLAKIESFMLNNPILQNDSYLTQFFDLLMQTKDKVKIDELWSDFDKQISVEINDVLEIFNDILDKPTIKKIKLILTNLGELNDIYLEKKEINVNLADKLFYESKCDLLKKFSKFLFNMFSKIKHESVAEVINISEIPKNWKIEQSYFENLIINLKNDNELVEKNIIEKRSKNLDIVFADLNNQIKIYKQLLDVSGQEHLFNCDGSINRYSKFTNKNCSAFLKYIFILLLKSLSSLQNSIQTSIVKLKEQTNTFTNDSLEINLQESIEKASIDSKESIDDDNNSLDVQQKILVLENSKTSAQKYISKLLSDLLFVIETNQEFYNKHTQKHINEVIEKTMDLEKEENLKFIEELDKESRQSLKSMITIGFETWKNLSKKTEKDLYFGENIQEEIIKENDSLNIIPNEEEIEAMNVNAAIEELGSDYTEEQFRDFLEKRENDRREEREILNDMDVMRDDDGDGEFGAEDEEEY